MSTPPVTLSPHEAHQLYGRVHRYATNIGDRCVVYILESHLRAAIDEALSQPQRDLAVRELVKIDLYFHALRTLISSYSDIPPTATYYPELFAAAEHVALGHDGKFGSVEPLSHLVRPGAYQSEPSAHRLAAYCNLRDYIVEQVDASAAQALRHKNARGALATVTLNVMRACAELPNLLDPHTRDEVHHALDEIDGEEDEQSDSEAGNLSDAELEAESGHGHHRRHEPVVRQLHEYDPRELTRPDLDFHFLHWRNHLSLAVQHQPWVHREHS